MSKIGSLMCRLLSSLSQVFLMIVARGSKFLYTRWPKPIRRKPLFLSLARSTYLPTLPPSAQDLLRASRRRPGWPRRAAGPTGADAGRDRGEQVRVARADHAHGRGAAVLLVIGMHDQQQVQRLRRNPGSISYGSARHREHHVQEVLAVRQVVPRIDERLPDRLLVGVGGDRRQLGHQPMDRDLDLVRIVRVERVLIERRQRADHRAADRHRMRVAREAAIKRPHVLVQHRVPAQRVAELARAAAASGNSP